MSETSKSFKRRTDNGDFAKFFSGRGIDIGCGGGAVTPDCDRYDQILGSGDAEIMSGVADETYDWVYSSHCLEHMKDIKSALSHWWRILKPMGYLIVIVPDFALYERYQWPSRFNPDHKWALSLGKHAEPDRLDIVALVNSLPNAQVLRAQLNEEGFNYNGKPDEDQPGQREIEVIARKWPNDAWCR